MDLARRLRLMVIADRGDRPDALILDRVEEALAAGAPAVQLRDKGANARDTVAFALSLARLTRSRGALFLVNDRADVALAVAADGVHVGQEDVPVDALRRALPQTWIIGASASTPDEATAAVAAGADYIGCGAVFATGSKGDAGQPIGPAGLEGVVRSVSVPVLGIGGITPDRAPAVAATGAAGAAVISAVLDATDVAGVVRAFRRAWPAGDG